MISSRPPAARSRHRARGASLLEIVIVIGAVIGFAAIQMFGRSAPARADLLTGCKTLHCDDSSPYSGMMSGAGPGGTATRPRRPPMRCAPWLWCQWIGPYDWWTWWT